MSTLEKDNLKLANSLQAKLAKLGEVGLALIGTQMLKRIEGYPDLYEIRAGAARVGIYYDSQRRAFILLDGFLKKRQMERQQVDSWRALADEYRSRWRR